MISPIPSWTARRTGLGNPMSPDTLEEWQLERFCQVIRHAREKSRFYRDHLAHVDPETITCREDLAGIPFTFPQNIVEQAPGWCASPRERSPESPPYSPPEARVRPSGSVSPGTIWSGPSIFRLRYVHLGLPEKPCDDLHVQQYP